MAEGLLKKYPPTKAELRKKLQDETLLRSSVQMDLRAAQSRIEELNSLLFDRHEERARLLTQIKDRDTALAVLAEETAGRWKPSSIYRLAARLMNRQHGPNMALALAASAVIMTTKEAPDGDDVPR